MAKEQLAAFGIKPSLHRIAVMEYLQQHLTHPTVDEIFSSLFGAIPTLSKTTVYNTLRLLEDKRAIAAISIDWKNVRYDADLSEHAHFICRCCGTVADLRLKSSVPVAVENAEGFRFDDCQIYYRGLCSKCIKDKSEH
jgi:Fur family ferric uptake transcriptional regulator/Fur family peroxide stress response transcriptional regulator